MSRGAVARAAQEERYVEAAYGGGEACRPTPRGVVWVAGEGGGWIGRLEARWNGEAQMADEVDGVR